MSRNYLSGNDELRAGSSLLSNNGKYKAVFQEDGNFVIYTGDKPLWASDTWHEGSFRLLMQSDCNLVIFDKNGTSKWDTNTSTSGEVQCHLELTNKGHLELSNGGVQVWSSETSKGRKLE